MTVRSPWSWLALSLSGCLLAHEASRAEDELPPPVFDPDEVYLLGRGIYQVCGGFVMSSWRAPTRPIADQLPCIIDRAVIRPQDGRLLYQLHDDGQGFLAVSDRAAPYEEPVDTSSCGDHAVESIVLNPDGGYVYGCDRKWYDALGRELRSLRDFMSTEPSVTAYGEDGVLLLGRSLWDLERGEQLPVRGLDETDVILTQRTLSDGFWLAVGDGYEGEIELWHLDLGGALSFVGSYGWPTRFNMSAALDARGDLFLLTVSNVDGHVSLEHRTLDGIIDTIEVDGLSDTTFERLVTGP